MINPNISFLISPLNGLIKNQYREKVKRLFDVRQRILVSVLINVLSGVLPGEILSEYGNIDGNNVEWKKL